MKRMSNNLKKVFELLLIEILTLIINFCFRKFTDNYFSNIHIFLQSIRIFFVIIINYYLCIKFVFKEKFKVKRASIIIFLSICTMILRKILLVFFLKHNIFLNNYFLILFVDAIFVMVDMYVKIKAFSCKELLDYIINNTSKLYNFLNQKWTDLLKKIKFISIFIPQNIFLFFLFLIVIFTSISFYNNNKTIVVYEQGSVDSNVGSIINNNVTVNFNDIKIDENVNILCLKFGTYNRVNDSILLLELYNNENKIILRNRIDAKKIVDGANYCIEIPTIDKKNIKKYKLSIKALKADNSNHVTLYKDKKTDKVALSLCKINKNHGRLICIIFIIIMYLLINMILNLFESRISHHKFLLFMLLYIIPLIFIYPPYSSPDENLHFYQSYSASQTIEIHNLNKIVLPKNISCLNYTNYNYKVNNFDKVIECTKSEKNKLYNITSSPGMKKDITPSSVSVGYLFQSLAIKIIDFFTNSPLIIYYFAKFVAALSSFLIVYLSLKKIPKYKNILLYLVTMPMFVQQMCSFSYDSLLNAIVILFFTCYVSVLCSKDYIKSYQYFIFAIVIFYLITLKIVYTPLILLLFLIPNNKFKNKKNKFLNLILILGFSLGLNYIVKQIFTTNAVVGSTGINQINFIINNPLYMLEVLKNTYILDSWNYIKGLYGFFSWFKFGFDDIIIIVNIVFMFLLFFSEESIYSKNTIKRMRQIIFIIIFMSVALIFGSMYFCWDYNYKLNYIAGVQGRYFLPLLPFLFLMLVPKKKKTNLSRKNLYMYINIMLFIYLIYSLIYFY